MATRQTRRSEPDAHGWFTIEKVAAIIGVIAILSPWVAGWFNQYQTKEDAARHAQGDRRSFGWIKSSLAEITSTVAKYRADDCLAKQEDGKLGPGEIVLCGRLQKEAEAASRRAEEARRDAEKGGKKTRKDDSDDE